MLNSASEKCWKRKLSLIRCTVYILSCLGIQLTSYPFFLFKKKNEAFLSINISSIDTGKKSKFSMYCYALLLWQQSKSIGKNILAKGILYREECQDFDFAAIDMKFPSANVFIFSILLGSFMAHSKILLFAFFAHVF